MARGPLWTPEQHDYIRRGLAAGLTTAEIAADLNRTPQAINAQVSLCGLSTKRRPPGPRRRRGRAASAELPSVWLASADAKQQETKLRLCFDRRVVGRGTQQPYTATYVLPMAFDPDKEVRGWMERHLENRDDGR